MITRNALDVARGRSARRAGFNVWDIDGSGTLDVDELQSMLLAASVGPFDRLPTAEEREAARLEVEQLVLRAQSWSTSNDRRWLGTLGRGARPSSPAAEVRACSQSRSGKPGVVTLAQFARVRRLTMTCGGHLDSRVWVFGPELQIVHTNSQVQMLFRRCFGEQ